MKRFWFSHLDIIQSYCEYISVCCKWLKAAVMEAIPKNDVLQYNPDTLRFLRNQYDLDNPIRLNESIDILEEWLKKQQHFVYKEWSRDYLERCLIIAKGSVEKVKKKLNSLCTFRTLLPTYFQLFDASICRNSDNIFDTLLPQMTPDHYRVYYSKIVGSTFDDLNNYFRWCIAIYEYFHAYDYGNGVIAIFDYTEAGVLDMLKVLDVMDVQHTIRILVDGYGVRLKGIHIVTPSKVINLIVSLFKQAASGKVKDRIFAHKDFETLYDAVPRDILPSECGGNDKSIRELHVQFVDALSSPKFIEYLKKMQKACTNEELRATDKFNNDFMGTPGSFRSLCLD